MGVNVEYEVADWGTVLQGMRIAPGTEGTPHRDAINHGQPFGDPTNFYANVTSMGGTSNWGGYKNDKVDALMKEAFETFDPAVQDAKIAEAHALVVDDAPRLFIVHDLNPRASEPQRQGLHPGPELVPGLHTGDCRRLISALAKERPCTGAPSARRLPFPHPFMSDHPLARMSRIDFRSLPACSRAS